MKRLLTSLIFISLAGCASVEPKKVTDLTSVKPKNHKQNATQYINKNLKPSFKDPSSIKIQSISELKSTSCKDSKGLPYKAWNAIALINAKNSFGAYTGAKPYQLWYSNGVVTTYNTPKIVINSLKLKQSYCLF